MATKVQPPVLLKPANFVITTLLRAGVKIGNMSLLTVRGRKSGQPRTTPVWLEEHNGQRWVISPYGQVNWVRNLRAAGEATLTRGRRTERVASVELPPQEAAPMLKQSRECTSTRSMGANCSIKPTCADGLAIPRVR